MSSTRASLFAFLSATNPAKRYSPHRSSKTRGGLRPLVFFITQEYTIQTTYEKGFLKGEVKGQKEIGIRVIQNYLRSL